MTARKRRINPFKSAGRVFVLITCGPLAWVLTLLGIQFGGDPAMLTSGLRTEAFTVPAVTHHVIHTTR